VESNRTKAIFDGRPMRFILPEHKAIARQRRAFLAGASLSGG
jgi:hypothetical protein